MKLENIGFYTLSDKRVTNSSSTSQLKRCEMVLSSRCNFNCIYCRRIGGQDMPLSLALEVLNLWKKDNLENIRFSGGEPTLYPHLNVLVKEAKSFAKRIALSTNGSASFETYLHLVDEGVNDLSISLDACCAEDNDKMTGGIKAFDIVSNNIWKLSKETYVTVGVVLTDDNVHKVGDIIKYAYSLGVSDIRIIPAAQKGNRLNEVKIDEDILNQYPILKYRINNILNDKTVRGLKETDSCHCGLVLDDMAVNHEYHYPCIIYMRESGSPIGKIGPTMREDRYNWFKTHNTYEDNICRNNCLDVCVDYNNKFSTLNKYERIR